VLHWGTNAPPSVLTGALVVRCAQMLSAILGLIVLNSDVPLPTNGPTMFVFGGFILMMVNVFALMALWHRRWKWLLCSEGIFAFLLVLIYASSIVAICLALELESPVAEAINKAWNRGSQVKLEMHQSWCLKEEDHEELEVCTDFQNLANAYISDSGVDEDECPYTRLQLQANCSLIDPDHSEVQSIACTPAATSEADRKKLFDDCQQCDQVCRETFIDTVADDLYPVSVAAYFMCFFVAVTALWNSFVVLEHATRKDEEGNTVSATIVGVWKLVSYGLNATVCIAGLVLFVVGLLMMQDAKQECRQQVGDAVADLECAEPSKSFIALLLLGICLAVCALISTLGVQKTAKANANFMWINLLRVTQIVYTLLGMLLLAAAIIFSLSSGALETVNSQYLSRFEGVREHLDNANPQYCRYLEGTVREGGEENERSWRSQCKDRIDCLGEDYANRNCAWDEEMYDAIHTADSPVDACSTADKPVKDASSQCKYLANLMNGLEWTEIADSFAAAMEEGGRQQRAQDSCAEAVQQTFDNYGRCEYAVDPILAATNDLFDCRRCFANQQFTGTGGEALCDDNDLEIEIMFQSTAMSCAAMATAGLCHFPVQAFNTFLQGQEEGSRKIHEICECSCRGNNGMEYDNGGINSTCIDVPPLMAEDAGPLDDVLLQAGQTPNDAGDVIKLGSHVDCTLFTDPASQCGMTLEDAAGSLTAVAAHILPAVSEGAKSLKVSEWCRDLCCGVDRGFEDAEDDGCGECLSETAAATYVKPACLLAGAAATPHRTESLTCLVPCAGVQSQYYCANRRGDGLLPRRD
jgi:hypothetical protein